LKNTFYFVVVFTLFTSNLVNNTVPTEEKMNALLNSNTAITISKSDKIVNTIEDNLEFVENNLDDESTTTPSNKPNDTLNTKPSDDLNNKSNDPSSIDEFIDELYYSSIDTIPADAVFHRNDKGEKIKLLQRKLNKYGYTLEQDGIFGLSTYDAVLNFQYRFGLEVDGIVGAETIAKLNLPPHQNDIYKAQTTETSEDNVNNTSPNPLEEYINSQDASSNTNYYVWVDLPNQRVNVFKGSNGNWTLQKSMLCSSGKPSTPTVKGHFKIQDKGPMFRAGSNTICKYYTRFYGNYLFHTVLLDNKGNIQDGRVGVPLSHGCIRLAIEDAKYFHCTVPYGTTVWIK
jgi:lipoprotein-anchoring transpeptidase ErfK/SrfK